jgi:pyruvate/2-oxoglutarate dehydrogenase complex dihydrolipoamide dehydrogenase (E3) component
MKHEYDLVVVGGGAAGLTTVSGCVQLGMKVALVENERMGGDCLHYGCVPSKTLIKSAEVYDELRHAASFGLPAFPLPSIDMLTINERVAGVIADIEVHDSKERFESLGADVFLESGRFENANNFILGSGRRLSSRRFVLATGSRAATPRIPGIEKGGFVTNREIFSLPRLPRRLIVAGGGPIGVEIGEAFAFLGSEVTIITGADRILERDDPDSGAIVAARLTTSGITVITNATIVSMDAASQTKRLSFRKKKSPPGTPDETVEGDELLLALGRVGNIENLDLDKIGIQTERNFVVTDTRLRTSLPHVLAIGDCNGRYLFTHVAGAEGGVAVRRLGFGLDTKMDYRFVPRVTYGRPELAVVGITENEAQEGALRHKVFVQSFRDNDRAHAEGAKEGFLKLVMDSKDRIIGTKIVSDQAGSLIAASLDKVRRGDRPTDLLKDIYPYPTLGEIYKRAAGAYLAPRLFNTRTRFLLSLIRGFRGRGPVIGRSGFERT